MEAKYNPWNVLSLEAFHFYNCPECDDKYATREQFVGHAMIVHEKAQATLPTILKNNLVISNVHSIQDKETEGCNDTEFELESSICIEKLNPSLIPNWMETMFNMNLTLKELKIIMTQIMKL